MPRLYLAAVAAAVGPPLPAVVGDEPAPAAERQQPLQLQPAATAAAAAADGVAAADAAVAAWLPPCWQRGPHRRGWWARPVTDRAAGWARAHGAPAAGAASAAG